MALAIFTEDQKTARGLSCSEELSEEEDGELILLSGINILLSIAAFIGNTLILVALHKETSLHPPSKLLYRNLAITDLCVGIIVEPSSVAYWMSLVNKRWNVCYYLYWITIISAQILCFAALYTLTAISVDRLLALLLGLRYRQVATLRRAYVTLIVFWLLSVVSGIQITSWLGRVGLTLCLFTSVFSYVKIIFTLRQNQIHVHNHVFQGQPSQAMPMNIARYRKAVYSALWVQVTFVVCYLPLSVVLALRHRRGMTLSAYIALQFSATLVYLNSSLNPFLYCWKIRGVRQAVKETLRQLFC